MSKDAYVFKFNDGRAVSFPLKAERVPRLPPRAVAEVLQVYKKHGVNPESALDLDNPDNMPFFMEMATVAVAYTLRRIDKSVTVEDCHEDADVDLILSAFPIVALRNPILFPKSEKGEKKPAPEADSGNPN